MPEITDRERTRVLVNRDELDLDSSAPLYKQLAALIKQKIDERQLPVGQKLQTEQDLSKELGVSISTVRNAYALLVKEGLVTRRAGRGSFVSRLKLSRSLVNIYNFTEEIRALGRTPSSDVLVFRIRKPSDDIAKALGIPQTDAVYEIERVRRADGNPILLETSYIPVALCPNLTDKDAEGSLYEGMMREMNSGLAGAHEIHEASVLSKQEAHTLERMPGEGTFRITRLTINTRGETCEYCLGVAPGDQTRYTIELGANGTKAKKDFLV